MIVISVCAFAEVNEQISAQAVPPSPPSKFPLKILLLSQRVQTKKDVYPFFS